MADSDEDGSSVKFDPDDWMIETPGGRRFNVTLRLAVEFMNDAGAKFGRIGPYYVSAGGVIVGPATPDGEEHSLRSVSIDPKLHDRIGQSLAEFELREAEDID